MPSHANQREKLDAAWQRVGSLYAVTSIPYLVAYVLLSLALSSSLELSDSLFIVVLTVLVLGGSIADWRRVRPTPTVRRGIVAASAVLGLLVAGAASLGA
ncbi:hypothetical protein [Nocardioides sp. YIM 152588]|uniref:hypothetical protein n=1 Tax=Nocardioides sp. YIM 152588 TaxID=3158259 RepID=UPI0032E40AFE